MATGARLVLIARHAFPACLICGAIVLILGLVHTLTDDPIRFSKVLVDKPRGDPRDYQIAELRNGLKVINVYDERSTKAAFSVSVEAGSFNDPADLPGLAHFCEHMLFLGTKKYPEASGFDELLAKSGGMSNAYTAPERTVYYADVMLGASADVFDHFADFFRAPLFDRRYVEKEMQAIDSEHQKNVQAPGYRIQEVQNSIADPRNPVSRFHTGNIETLYTHPNATGQDVVARLQVYFDDYYCPRHMFLATYGSNSLAEQLNLAAKGFSGIPEGSVMCKQRMQKFDFPPPFPPDRLRKWVTVQGAEPNAKLRLIFSLPDLTPESKSGVDMYLAHLFNWAGVGGLCRTLEDALGLVQAAGAELDETSAGTQLTIYTELTDLGRKHLALVMDEIFVYIASLMWTGVNEHLYKSLADASKFLWNWQEAQTAADTVSDLAGRMTKFHGDEILSAGKRIDVLDLHLAADMVSRLRPENMNVIYVEGTHYSRPFAPSDVVRKLAHYGVEYTVQEFDDAMPGALERWAGWLLGLVDNSDIQKRIANSMELAGLEASLPTIPKAPEPIQDVPQELAVEDMRAQIPETISSGGTSSFGLSPTASKLIANATLTERSLAVSETTFWYRRGWVTSSPSARFRTALRVRRRPNEKEGSALDAALLMLYDRLLTEELQPKMVDLVYVGQSFIIDISEDMLAFAFGGFEPAMKSLVENVLREFNNFNRNLSVTSPARFKRVLTQLRRDLASYTDMPVIYAMEDLSTLVSRGAHSKRELQIAISDDSAITSHAAAKVVGRQVLSKPLEFVSLAMGNIKEAQARDIMSKVASGIELPSWLPASAQGTTGEVEIVPRVVKVSHPVEVRIVNPRPDDPNDVVVVQFFHGIATVEKRVLLGLLGEVFRAVSFEELRTSMQLGYIVQGGTGEVSNVLHVTCLVQGTVLGADEVEAAIESVLSERMPKKLREMTEQQLDDLRRSYRGKVMQPPVTAGDEEGHWWLPATRKGKCMHLQEALLSFLDSGALTIAALNAEWEKLMVLPEDGFRRKVVVKYFAKRVPTRPTAEELQLTWLERNLSAPARELLAREYNRTLVLNIAGAAARKQLEEKGDYYPQDLHCGGTDSGAADTHAGARFA